MRRDGLRGIPERRQWRGKATDNAAAEGFFGLLKRERVNWRKCQTRIEARADVFDYIERFHNPR